MDWINEWEKEVNAEAAKSYRELGLKPSSRAKSMPEFALQREVLGWLIAARSGQGHFADYHERFGHDEQDVHCQCGKKRAQLHPFFVPKGQASKRETTLQKAGEAAFARGGFGNA